MVDFDFHVVESHELSGLELIFRENGRRRVTILTAEPNADIVKIVERRDDTAAVTAFDAEIVEGRLGKHTRDGAFGTELKSEYDGKLNRIKKAGFALWTDVERKAAPVFEVKGITSESRLALRANEIDKSGMGCDREFITLQAQKSTAFQCTHPHTVTFSAHIGVQRRGKIRV